MNILITGGCGFIGSNFINYYIDKYPNNKIYNIDCLNYCSKIDNVNKNKNYKFIEGNICDKNLVNFILKEYNIDIIIHFAAQSHVDNSFENALQYTIDNVLGTHTLLDCSMKYGNLKLFLHFSTDEVYGQVSINHPGCIEESILNPTNPYSATKAAAEFLVTSYNHSFKMNYIIVRCNNVYGPNQYHEKLIPRFIYLLKNKEKLTIQGDGNNRRKFIHVLDVCSALDIILEKCERNNIINISTKNEFSVLEIAEILIREIYGEDLNKDEIKEKYLSYVKDRPFNDFRYNHDGSKLLKLGWKENISFMDGIKMIL